MMNTRTERIRLAYLRIRALTIKMTDCLYVDGINNCYLRAITGRGTAEL